MPSVQTSSARRAIRARPTTARGPSYGVPASLALHALGVAVMLFAFSSSHAPLEDSTVVPVDLIIAESTNVTAAAPPAPQEEPQEDLFVPPAPPEAVPPPLPEIAEPAPVEAQVPEFKVAQPPPPKPEPPKPEPPKPAPKPPAPRNDINALLNQLTRAQPNTAKPAPTPGATSSAGAAGMATASLADALRSQIRNCWSPMTGAPNPEDQVVSFSLRLNRDGTVGGLEILSVRPNSYGAAAAEAASRAIYQCAPYRLPLERYAQWREFRPLRFDPRQMMAQ